MIKQLVTTVFLSVLNFISSIFSFGPANSGEKFQPKSPVSSPSAYLQEAKQTPNSLEITFNKVKYWARWVKITDPKNLFLYPNFKERQSSGEIIKTKNCRYLTNGSFYSKDGTPIGLFVSQGWKTSNAFSSPLFNSYFFLTNDNEPIISGESPSKPTKIGLQSGPRIFEDAQAKILKVRNDKTARRIVLAITPNREVVFIVFYDPENNLQGPYLNDLPLILKEFTVVSRIKLKDALNLDGGSASAFYDGEFFLPEFNSIGSYFCTR